MRYRCVVLALFLGTAGCVSATPLCATLNGSTFAALQAAGSCTIGDVTFANFTYSYSGYYSSGPFQAIPAAGGDFVPASAVTVQVDASDSELLFQQSWNSLAPDHAVLTIGLTAVDNQATSRIQTASAEIEGNLSPDTSGPGGANQYPGDFFHKSGACLSGCPLPDQDILTSAATNLNIPVGQVIQLQATGEVSMDPNAGCGNGNTYANGGCNPDGYDGDNAQGHMSQLGLQAGTAGVVNSNLPEPASFLLAGAGLGLALFLKKRRA